MEAEFQFTVALEEIVYLEVLRALEEAEIKAVGNRPRQYYNAQNFMEGDNVLAYDKGLLYEAKVLRRRKTDICGDIEYFIHFKGFNSKWDQWIDYGEVLEINDTNVGHKKRLIDRLKYSKKSKKIQISKQTNSSKNSSPKLVLKKNGYVSNIISNTIPHSKLLADKLRNIVVPHILRKAMFLDFVMNNTFQKLLKFPEKHFLSEILYAFTQSSYFVDDSQKKTSTMLCVTLMQYFNSTVHTCVLYNNEKRYRIYDKGVEYFQQRKKNQPNITYIFENNLNPKKIWCYVYGPIYLLRFLANLPIILISNSWHPECDLDIFVLHIKELFRFLENNYDTYFTVNDYIDV